MASGSRIDVDELAKLFYEQANELGVEVLGVRAFPGNWQFVSDFNGSVAHNGMVLMADKIKIKLCHSGNYTIHIIRRKHPQDPNQDVVMFKHKSINLGYDFKIALLAVRDKMFVNV